MPRFKVVATVVLALALALILASCSEPTDSLDENKVTTKQNKLVQAHGLGQKAHQSMVKYGFDADEGDCKAHYAATMANDLGSDAMVDLGREYFVDGCMKGSDPTIEAKAP
jgi:hypothetical protein